MSERSEIAEESVVAQVQSMLCDAMKRAKLSRAEVARRIGCSRSQVTRLLQGDANPSIRTIAKLLNACNYDFEFHLAQRVVMSTQVATTEHRLILIQPDLPAKRDENEEMQP